MISRLTHAAGKAALAGLLASGLLTGALAPAPAAAQTTTTSITGTVSDDTGILPGASIVARHVTSGFTYEAVADAKGAFVLSGLAPGSYEITVALPQYKPQARTVQLLAGQSVSLTFRITPDLVYTEQVEVVARAGCWSRPRRPRSPPP